VALAVALAAVVAVAVAAAVVVDLQRVIMERSPAYPAHPDCRYTPSLVRKLGQPLPSFQIQYGPQMNPSMLFWKKWSAAAV
jgi:hypothetical protein